MRRLAPLLLLGLLLSSARANQPKRVLYVTYSAGYRHDCLPVSAEVLQNIAAANGQLEVVETEDLSMLNADTLSGFDALLFFTSGELPISDSQKQDLLNFVRSGKGFGGAHSATDTFYTLPEYGDLIGARFNGHPWAQQVTLDVEDPAHPAVTDLAPNVSLFDEIYQFRDFSRDSVRVLMTLDAHSVDLAAAGVNPNTEDFPLTWCRRYGLGRVFYTALGHFESTWRDPRFSQMMLQAMLWLTGQTDGDATPRPPKPPSFLPNAIGNSAGLEPRMTIAPGSLITLFGSNLTAGSTLAADPHNPPYKLAGSILKLNDITVPLLYASPSQINAYVPFDLEPQGTNFDLKLIAAGGGPSGTVTALLMAAEATPGVFTTTATRNSVTLWGTGFGPVQPSGDLQTTITKPTVTIAGQSATVLFSGLTPGWIGLYQINVAVPPAISFPALLDFQFGSYEHRVVLNPQP